jgi:hypothetical protein
MEQHRISVTFGEPHHWHAGLIVLILCDTRAKLGCGKKLYRMVDIRNAVFKVKHSYAVAKVSGPRNIGHHV